MAEILIVEDEVKLRQELATFLNNNGYTTKEVADFRDTLDQMLHFDGDLILLDINLPNVNGQFLCKEYRKQANKPIIIVTSRNDEMDELMCINYGADDFITKPYNPLILLARIEAVLKRMHPQNELVINYQDIQLDVSKSCLIKEKQIVDLSKNELKIFYYLLSHRGTIISRDTLMSYLWDSDMFVDDNTLTVNINRLRKKLEDIGLSNVILTKRKQGYIIL
ncbi:response regulator transcription factor [uncultured Thomasclavelia sp.]|uniref:response regulator transcription factor n=1 Tax=uncultured Thomasclavelia sp. TaxID=3025759 RepID=UPI0025E4CE41|nr:response regulator transcription factor [uncultured Thomasclavelia sp.]